MDSIELAARIRAFLPFEPVPLQAQLIEALAAFICTGAPRDIFMLNGYAGSGKTSIMAALIKALSELKVKSVTLAPTGRAAKVASDFSGGKASTIHRRIYRPESASPDARYVLAPNHDSNAVFIIDEASLITDSPSPAHSLLCQMLRHIFSSEGNRIILVGDMAQLPPVGMTDSPAMNPERIRQLGLNPILFVLDIPMRQSAHSGVLYNATRMRQLMFDPSSGLRPEILVDGFDDVEVISSADMADCLTDSWADVGCENTIIITRSNSRANRYNQAIRNLVMMAEEPLQRGDRLVIAKNDYYWSKLNKATNFIANGDMAEVKWVGRSEKMYGRYFTDVELFFPSSGMQIGAKLMLRSLMAEGPAIPTAEMDRFYTHVIAAQEGELSERIKATMEDPFYNALQAKYGYCITCHKAQGGQWEHVYIDMSGINPDELDENFYRWFYTALTRTTGKVFFINPTLPVR
ncbi:MAG: AAA family ATPase [Muribaculaceae bacterium]|nr:AAA family ATPase [Muribaculaceae bacterium]MDE5958503.1 AAA family ATPase [Muribaculaceae bacterium]